MDPELVLYLEALAGLKLTPNERGELAGDLTRILIFMDQLDEIPTDGVAPTTHPVRITSPRRPDVPQESLPVEAVLEQAPDTWRHHFRVPPVFNKDHGESRDE